MGKNTSDPFHSLTTEYVVVNFVKSHLKRKGIWRQEYDAIRLCEPFEYPSAAPEICQSLCKISLELQDFIEADNRFEEALSVIDPEHTFIFEELGQVADELFLTGITWSHIVTFLYYMAEFFCKITRIPDRQLREETWNQTLDWIHIYILDNLSPWIKEQEGGWLDIHNYTKQKDTECLQKSQKTLRHYVSVTATIAVILGGLYLGSKINFV